MEFLEVEKYLKENGLNYGDYRVSLDINNIELNIGANHEYFISVGKWTDGTFEVFAHGVGAKWDEDGFCIEDGKLIQYKIFKSLKRAIDFSLKYRNFGKLPNTYIKIW